MQVFKGKKMAGHMGAVRRTVKNVWIYKIEPERDLMWVRGQVCAHIDIELCFRAASFMCSFGTKPAQDFILVYPAFSKLVLCEKNNRSSKETYLCL